MKHMNYNAAENQPHKYARPVTLDEMNRMPGQEEYERRTRTSKVFSLGRGLYQAVMYPEEQRKTGRNRQHTDADSGFGMRRVSHESQQR